LIIGWDQIPSNANTSILSNRSNIIQAPLKEVVQPVTNNTTPTATNLYYIIMINNVTNITNVISATRTEAATIDDDDGRANEAIDTENTAPKLAPAGPMI
jgi:hypothetical protein